MHNFYTFIPKKEKKEELLPLYLELDKPYYDPFPKKDEEEKISIIQIL